MFKKTASAIWFVCKCAFYTIYYPLFAIWWLVKGIFWPLRWVLGSFRKVEIVEPQISKLPEESAAQLFSDVKIPEDLPPEEPVSRVGTVNPVEEDHELRQFTIVNTEGEIYRINTALPGPFYGPVWTRILESYETQQTLRARLTKVCRNQEGKYTGFRVKIGSINAFLPMSQALRLPNQPPINIITAVTHVDPLRRAVIVSSRAAYSRLFSGKKRPQAGDKTRGVYWDYDEQFLYLLLPGEVMATARRGAETPTEVAAMMGEMANCVVETMDDEKREATVKISCGADKNWSGGMFNVAK